MEEKSLYSFQTDVLYILNYQFRTACYKWNVTVTSKLQLPIESFLRLQVFFIELKVVPAILTPNMLWKDSLSYFNTYLPKPDLWDISKNPWVWTVL